MLQKVLKWANYALAVLVCANYANNYASTIPQGLRCLDPRRLAEARGIVWPPADASFDFVTWLELEYRLA